MAFLHRSNHFIALFIEFDAGKCNFTILKLLHQRLKLETFRRSIRILVITIAVFSSMARCIKDMEHLLGRTITPVLIQTFPQSTNDIFRKVATTNCLNSRYEILDLLDIFSERLNGESLCVTMISVANETDSDLEVAGAACDDVLYNFLKSFLCSFNPGAH